MFYIVESQSQLNRLSEKINSKIFVKVFRNNDNYHPILTTPVAVYIKILNSLESFIIPVDHTEGINVDSKNVGSILSNAEEIFVDNKKEFLYSFILPQVTDLNLLCNNNFIPAPDRMVKSNISNLFYHRDRENYNLNKIIPISKLFEEGENLFESYKNVFSLEKPSGFSFYNDLATKVFYLLEQNGLKVVYEPFVDMFKPSFPDFNIKDNITYPYYNLYNITSRPTNSFNSVNYSAIPHKEEYRKSIIPKNDSFIEFDFDGYHLRLLSNQIGYKLDNTKAHKQLASLYFGKDEITDEEYTKAKQINFQSIYGQIPKEYAHLEIFNKIQNYIDNLWSDFSNQGYVNAPISMKRFSNKLPDMNPQKLMNYIIQSLETSRNILILKDVLNCLKNKKSNIVLYTYDSIVLDYSKDDGEDLLDSIESILVTDGYPIGTVEGKNLMFQN